jgi:hypothetical protein
MGRITPLGYFVLFLLFITFWMAKLRTRFKAA